MKTLTPEEIDKIQTELLWEKYTEAIQRLLNDGMTLEELQARMTRYLNLDLNHQAIVMEMMWKYRRAGILPALKN